VDGREDSGEGVGEEVDKDALFIESILRLEV
jgi:hypothetical protein